MFLSGSETETCSRKIIGWGATAHKRGVFLSQNTIFALIKLVNISTLDTGII